jgi:hypothetical protein
MKSSSNIPVMNDDQLHRVLRQVPAQVKLPASFGREVWARIEAEASLSFRHCISRLTQSLFAMLARPLPAGLTIAAFIALGAWLGGWGRAEHAAAAEMAYVESIHPLLQGSMENMP